MFEIVQHHLQPVERLVPELPVALHPVMRLFKCHRPERAELLPALPAFLDQPRPLQAGQMLGDRLLGNAERLGQLVDRGRALPQAVQDHPPGGVGEGGEGVVEGIHNYMVVYYEGKVNTDR